MHKVNEKYKSFDGTELSLNLSMPENQHSDAKPGLVVFFFGGGWTGGTTKQFEPQAKELNRLGVAAARPEYRVLSADHTPIDVAVRDAVWCVSYLYENAARLGIDPKKIVLSGGSAGAHLAVSALLLTEFIPETFSYPKDIAGLLLCNPVLDTVWYREKSEAIQQSAYEASAFSPLHHVRSGLPDTVIFHGTDDHTVPFSTSEQYAKQAAALGNSVSLIPYPGRDHGFFNLRESNRICDYYDVLGRMVQFLYHKKILELT